MADLVEVKVQVPTASWALQVGARKVLEDVAKALADGWQPWGDASAIVRSVTENIVPVAGNVSKVPAELVAHPVEMARLAGLVLGDLAGFALKKVRG